VCRNAWRDFDIGVEMVNNTALFTRLDGAVSEVINPAIRSRQYGHSFEKRFVKASDMMQGVGEHYRIVGYTFGGLNLVVRFITDAYNVDATLTTTSIAMQHPIAAQPPVEKAAADTAPPAKYPLTEAFMDKLVKQLSTMAVGKKVHDESATRIPLTGSSTSPSGQRLSIYRAGELVPQEHIIELKTTTRDCTPQRWFSNTRHLYIGIHKKGVFTSVTKQSENDAMIAAWEQSQKVPLGRLAELLGQIVGLGKENRERMRIRCVQGTLVLQDWDTRETRKYWVEPLPAELKEKWRRVA